MVSLVFFGDFVCQKPENVSYSERLKEWIQADIAGCNFEAPVYSDGKPLLKSGPNLYQSERAPKLLADMGFNLILLANNHIMDYGHRGLTKTKDSFPGLLTLGAGNASTVYDSLVIERKGIRIGLLSLVQHEFGVIEDLSQNTVGTAWISHPIVESKIKEAKNRCDVLVVLPHAGFENIDAPLPEWRDKYKALIDQGADIVIASHPHVPQGWEVYKGKRIYYSLGNFCFDTRMGNNPYWANSLSVKVLISQDLQISYEHENIVFNEGLLDIDESDEIKRHFIHLQSLLISKEDYESYIDSQLDLFWESYKLYILRGLGAFSFCGSFNTLLHSAYGVLKGADIPMLINNFQCETHSWAIQRILKNLMSKNKYEHE